MPADSKVIAVIPARWASSRFPGKPLALIKGKPMIQWVFEQASKAKSVSEVIVATDDIRILETVNKFGGNAVMTSEDHESGTDRIAEVVRDRGCEIVVNVQGDEPLIPPENIDRIVLPLLEGAKESTVTLRILIKTQEELNVRFHGQLVGVFRADMIVEGKVLLELKAVRSLDAVHEAQLLNYLKATGIEIGLLLNFGNTPEFKRRVFNTI
mgnify:CR=1 FL=1